MGVVADKYVATLKKMNTTMKKDIEAGHPWSYTNKKEKGKTFQQSRSKKYYRTNCVTGAQWGMLDSGVINSKTRDGMQWYASKGKIVWLNSKAEKNAKKYFDIIPVKTKTVQTCITDGTLKKGDVVTYMSLAHTNVYLGDNKSFDTGHAFCSGSGEGAKYKKWIGTTPYRNYKVAFILRPKEPSYSRKPKYAGRCTTPSDFRVCAGSKYPHVAEHPVLEPGIHVEVCDEVINAAANKWLFVRVKGTAYVYGWVVAKNIQKI